MSIDQQELAKKAKSKFGPAKPLARPRWKTMLEDYFFKSSTRKAFLQGGITIGLIVYWWFTRSSTPLIIWFLISFSLSIIALIYWRTESLRLNKEIKKYEQEIKSIQSEIIERQDYYEGIKDQLNKMMKKN